MNKKIGLILALVLVAFLVMGTASAGLFDFLGDDFLTVIDESHVTIPQIGGMYNGDRARKSALVEHGFRLPSAMDNRPLSFKDELERNIYAQYTFHNNGRWCCRKQRSLWFARSIRKLLVCR